MRVELVFFTGCPSVPRARQRLTQALVAAGLSPSWQEWDTRDPRTPSEYQRYGSPTVLIDGRNIAGDDAPSGPTCAVDGGPSVAVITAALHGDQ